MKRISLILLVISAFTFAYAQKPVIEFETKTWDFGKFNEQDGSVTYQFQFTNRGGSPLVVSRVQASCGCTTPTWTKEPIEPGKKGSITVSYNPAGRPGVFTKSITVYSNATEEQSTLLIKGEVLTKPKTPTDNFPMSFGADLRAKTKMVQMNNVEKGKSQVRQLEVMNNGKSPLKVNVENLPSYITYNIKPEVLNPEQSGIITFTFNSKLCSKWGPITDEVIIVVNNKKNNNEEYKVKILSNLIENFRDLTLEQKQKAPIVDVSERTINIGVVKADTKKPFKIKIGNKGIGNLEIRRVINYNKDIFVTPEKITVHGGKNGFITVNIDAKGMNEGDYRKTITLQTNDPDNSLVTLMLNWKVQK